MRQIAHAPRFTERLTDLSRRLLVQRQRLVVKIVIRKAKRRERIAVTNNIHDPARAALQQLRHVAIGEEAEVLGRQLHLEAIGAERARGELYDAGVVDENVNKGVGGCEDFCNGGGDGGEGERSIATGLEAASDLVMILTFVWRPAG